MVLCRYAEGYMKAYGTMQVCERLHEDLWYYAGMRERIYLGLRYWESLLKKGDECFVDVAVNRKVRGGGSKSVGCSASVVVLFCILLWIYLCCISVG